MAVGDGAEVIDLTTSDVEEIPAAQALRLRDVAKEAPRAQKKRKASAVLEEGEVVDSGLSRASSRVSERASERSKDGRGEGGKKRKQKKSKSASSSRNSPASQDKSLASKQEPLGGDSLFFVDVTPAVVSGGQTFPELPIPSTSASASSAAAASPPAPQATSTPSLLLPAHVSITEVATDSDHPEPVHTSSSDVESETESFIEYLDYNDQATGMTRYFDDRSEEAKKSRHVCKKCGAEGEHSTRDCPVLICLTCGVRDEHSTHSCPISKTCYNCGLKGHISSNCPNRRAHDLRDACQRCYSRKHNTHLCPSHWRIYEYVSDSERQAILEARERLRALGLGEGGEAYIAQDEWCYNCGDSGHLGDDCKAANFIDHVPEEPSAFSAYNTASGPFSDERPSTSSRRRRPREWENGFEFTNGHGFKVPSNVGERARAKDRKRMAERAQQADKDDEEDWFNDPNRNIRIRGVASAGSSQSKKDPPTAPRSFKFAVNGVESGSKSKAPAKPERVSLQDRIGDRDPRSDRRDHRRDNSSNSQFRRSDRDDKRGKGKSEREWDRGKRYADPDLERRHWGRHDSGRRDDDRSRPGPRYHGGYGR